MDIYSKIDSDRFGFKIGKIDTDFFSNISVEEGVDIFDRNDFELIFARIDYTNLELINNLEHYGFTIKDIQNTLYYFFKDGDIFDPIRTDEYIIRESKPSDTEMIVDLTRKSFNGYGHYSTDKRLDPKDCLEAYCDWAYNCCINKSVADKIFVADKDGEVVAYIAWKEHSQEDKKYSAGVIGAANPEHRGKGLFQSIDIAGLQWGQANGFDWTEHNVLIDNYSAFGAHYKVGYRPNKLTATLHGWNEYGI